MIRLLKKPKKYNKPKKVWWWLELICNLRCNHCDIGRKTLMKKFKPALTMENKKLVIDKLHKWLGDRFSLSFIAGEPFLHRDMFDILSYAHQKKIVTSVTSNGTLISTPKEAEKVVTSGLDFIALSLDSFESKIHDDSRGRKGVRDQIFLAVKNIKKAQKKYQLKNPTIYINSIIMRDNLEELPKLVKWVKKEKIDGITFQPIANPDMFGGSGKKGDLWFKNSQLWPDTKLVLSILDQLKKMRECGYPIKNSDKDFEKFRKYFISPLTFAQGPPNKGELESISITHDGLIKMCPSVHENFGSIFKDDLDEMWHSKIADKARDHIMSCKSQCKILANNKEDFYF